jgi:predicted regulator of Ras-like GTPase activity (Roadblock/LC7/MglB family)
VSDLGDVLRVMCERVPDAAGAIFVDWEGEPVVQFAQEMPALDIQIFGAQWGVVWNGLQKALDRARLGEASELVVEWDGGAVLVGQVTKEYFVVLFVRSDTHLATALRELEKSVAALRAEI